jgi:hypothetical protein
LLPQYLTKIIANEFEVNEDCASVSRRGLDDNIPLPTRRKCDEASKGQVVDFSGGGRVFFFQHCRGKATVGDLESI